ncbi:MAG: hypothetical protein K2P53_04790 [Rickettsiales bacterium]|jgi:hypothetical protein|nr:hypothetical protein [Rickettsiales bacterium]
MIIKRLINQSIQNQALNSDDVKKCMNACLKGGATPAQISSFFTSLLMKGFSQEEFDEIIKGINFPAQEFKNINIDFYIYSFLQDNFSLAVSLILAELDYFVYEKFKNLYLDNASILNTLKESENNQNEENLLTQYHIHLSLSEYNKTLKNILFLKSELEFDSLLSLLQLSINPVNSKHKIIIMDENDFLELKTIKSFLNLFKDNLFVIVSDNIINLIKIENYKLHKEKTLHFDNLENYNSCLFTQVIRDEFFFKSMISIINEIFDLLKINCEQLNKPNIDLKNELCEGIINKYLKYFEVIKRLDRD